MEEYVSKDWLNKQFLQSCLSGGSRESSDIRIRSFEARPGVAVGNNYGSEILRVKVVYTKEESSTEEKLSLIMKAPVQTTVTEFMKEIFGMTEFNFYYKYMSRVREISEVQFAPESYFSPLDCVVVLEDLKKSGFTMADRHEQLDFDHCRRYFTVSGKLHAVGVALLKKYPELPEMFPSAHDQLQKNQDKSKVMWRSIVVGLSCLVNSVEALNLKEYRTYIDLIKELIKCDGEKFQMLTVNSMKLQDDHFKSLIHGDCWTTNMMFRHDELGNPVDIRLLDFQIFNYDSVVSDVIGFTWMSANNEVLEHHLEELYRLYCDSLNSALEEYGCEERFSYERLKKEVLERSTHILTVMGVFLPLTQSDTLLDSSALFSETLTEDQFVGYYRGSNFWKKFPRVLKLAADQGIFNWLEHTCIKLELLV